MLYKSKSKSKSRSFLNIGQDLEATEEEIEGVKEMVDIVINLKEDTDYDVYLGFGVADLILIKNEKDNLRNKMKNEPQEMPKIVSGALETIMGRDIIDKHTTKLGGDLSISEFLIFMELYMSILEKRKASLEQEVKDTISERV